MRIAFFVNDFEREHAGYTTTVLAHQAAMRGHEVFYLTPSDFVLRPDDSLCAHGRLLPKKKYKDRDDFFATLMSGKCKTEPIDLAGLDILMLRSDPSIDAETPWAAEAGILFGREAANAGPSCSMTRTASGARSTSCISRASLRKRERKR